MIPLKEVLFFDKLANGTWFNKNLTICDLKSCQKYYQG